MILSEQTKILAGILLIEQQVDVIDYSGDVTVVIQMGKKQYVIDPYANDLLNAWQELIDGNIVPNTTQQELYKIGLGSRHRELLRKIMKQIKEGATREPPDITGVPPALREWFEKYIEAFEKLSSRGSLFLLPPNLGSVFKNSYTNYRMYDDPVQDYIAILPTPKGMLVRGRTSDRGVYVLRKEAHRNFPNYGIRAGDTNYISKIESVVGNNLLSVRNVLEDLNLGIFYRRDHRLLTVTEWIPSGEFSSFDELKDWSDAFVEQIRRIARML